MLTWQAWQLYLMIGTVLCILEMAFPALILLPLGIAAIETAPLSLFLPPWLTLILWAVLALGDWKALAILAKRRHPKIEYASGSEGMIGQRATVIERVIPETQQGRVKLYSDEWQVIPTEQTIEVGQSVTITEVVGNKVKVRWES